MDDKVKKDGQDPRIPPGMKLPEFKTRKVTIRETRIDENGLTHEVEREISVPILPDGAKDNGSK